MSHLNIFFLLLKHCTIILGITARKDCLGPNVLNGLRIVTGV